MSHPPLNVEQALRDATQRGIAIGMKRHAVQFLGCCPRHHCRLIPLEKQPWLFACMFCELEWREQHALPQRTTGQLGAIPANRFLQYCREMHPDGGPETTEHRAVQVKKEK